MAVAGDEVFGVVGGDGVFDCLGMPGFSGAGGAGEVFSAPRLGSVEDVGYFLVSKVFLAESAYEAHDFLFVRHGHQDLVSSMSCGGVAVCCASGCGAGGGFELAILSGFHACGG